MPEKWLYFCKKPFFEPFFNFFEIAALRTRAPLMRGGDSQMVPGLKTTADAKGCPIQAISRYLSLVLLCEMEHYRLTKSLCHVFWPIPVVFRSMRDLN
ncbi:hypothetical protein TNCT_552151 [Trichonephila clavata]|uniref:Uncharacterized protein n=1 Tax=Trichonephila clavata TaxID=2740835 RepID=A0A8X6LGR9_TRICU|nr:hypothetical protein TNCT_552151 [Trichonephila clavata]